MKRRVRNVASAVLSRFWDAPETADATASERDHGESASKPGPRPCPAISNLDRPIEEYALIGNCETAALINADGGIDWLCLPAFDGPSLFGALLDREKGGEFSIRPAVPYRTERRYRDDDSAIFETRFITDRGTVLVTDFFVAARRRGVRGYDFTSLYPTRKLVRLIELESGAQVPMEMLVRARPNYGRDDAVWTGIAEGGFTCGHAAFFTNTGARWSGHDLAAEWPAAPGQCAFAVLDYGEEQPVPTVADIHRWHRVTDTFWTQWGYFNHYRGRHARTVRRSAVTLKLLTHAPTGGFIAAPTTSLPEIPGGDSNWDYRFVWVRDSSFFINTLFRLGYSGEATAFLNFIVEHSMASEKKGGDVLPVMFPVQKTTSFEEQELTHLRGYRDSRPVRIGNRAADQFQLDDAAHLAEALFCYTHTGGRLDAKKKHLIRTVAENICQRWREPDSGLWEEQERKLYTYGKVSSWAALMRAAKLAEVKDLNIEETCADIRTEVLARALHGEGDRQHMVSRFDSEDLDAACLVTFLNGFSAPQLAANTRERIESALGDGPFLFRNPEQRAKGEGAFFLCMFWRISHLVKEGDINRAEALLDEAVAMQSPFGLLSEEIDPKSRALLGNFPQAFSHLGLIGAVLNVDQARRKPAMAGLPDHEKFTGSVGYTVGLWAIPASFWRAPKTIRLLFRSGGSKWKEPSPEAGNKADAGGVTRLIMPSNSSPDAQHFISYKKALVAGIVGGIVGTGIKTLCELVSPPREPGQESPLGKLLGMVSVMISGHDMPDELKMIAEKMLHWGFGIGAGVVYSLIAERWEKARIGKGAGFGVAFWVGLHEIFLPLIKCSASPLMMTMKEQGNELVSHILYGMGVELTRRFIRRRW